MASKETSPKRFYIFLYLCLVLFFLIICLLHTRRARHTRSSASLWRRQERVRLASDDVGGDERRRVLLRLGLRREHDRVVAEQMRLARNDVGLLQIGRRRLLLRLGDAIEQQVVGGLRASLASDDVALHRGSGAIELRRLLGLGGGHRVGGLRASLASDDVALDRSGGTIELGRLLGLARGHRVGSLRASLARDDVALLDVDLLLERLTLARRLHDDRVSDRRVRLLGHALDAIDLTAFRLVSRQRHACRARGTLEASFVILGYCWGLEAKRRSTEVDKKREQHKLQFSATICSRG
jgi:hypothetical protein